MTTEKSLVATAITAGLILCSCGTQADVKQDAQNSISAGYTRIADAMSRAALSAFEANYDPAFVQIDDSGVEKIHSITELDAQMRPSFAHRSEMHLVTKVQNLVVDGLGATVIVRQDYTYIRQKNGQPSHYHLVVTSRDYWSRQGSKWLLKRSRTLTGKLTVDGHAVPDK